ncbi:amidohydrolase family protein [Rhodococcus coprophilus]|uniref:Cytosine deaminase n=1 Tax=Rhodococcus coprophilus TaxID=38310 RepID=A0A2X4U7H8_9NOCA|nr:amidohydrolase family protein [Rhodococcus coprophilus]SQI35827.1 cytosine deaminase [Rhodococcus coprophilus]
MDESRAHGREVAVLRRATTADGSRVDVHMSGGTVTAVVPATPEAVVADDLDLDGYLLLPAPAEPHAHLDKALSWNEIRPPMGDLASAITAWRDYSAQLTVTGVAARARRAALSLLANGTTAVRTHVDLLPGPEPLRGVHALLQVREELASVMDIQLTALTPHDVGDEIVEEAIDLGVDFVGGSPHHAPDPSATLQRLLSIAKRRGVGVDMHTDEQLDPNVLTLLELAETVRGWPDDIPVTAGHCVSLGTVDPGVRAHVIEAVRATGIGIVALPITNLYLQGWGHPVATPRGLTPVRALLDAGVRVAGGADNVRDPFNPLGRSDALETAMLLVTAGHLTTTEAYEAVSTSARDIMSLPLAGVAVGAQADFLAIRAHDLDEAVAEAPSSRHVLHRGRLVATSVVSSSVHVPLAASLESEVRS